MAGHGNRRGGGVALPALAFARPRTPECRAAARLLRTISEEFLEELTGDLRAVFADRARYLELRRQAAGP